MSAVTRSCHRWSVVAVGLGAIACAHAGAPHISTEGTFFDPAGHVLTDAQVSARLRRAQFVLVGEAHDNPCDHRQEAHIATLMAQSGRPFAVGLEMVTTSRQPVLDQFSSGDVALASLGGALDWHANWGFAFDWYAPIFEAAHQANAPVVALNASDAVMHDVRATGVEGLPLHVRMQFPTELIPPPAPQQAELRESFAAHVKSGHASGKPDAAWDRFLRVQSLWDTYMAWRASKAAQILHRPVLIIAGAGHVEHGWGIAHRLRVFEPGASTLSIVPWHGDAFDPSAADLFFYCQAVPEKEEPSQPQPAPVDSVMLPGWKKPPSTDSPPTL